MDLYKNVEIAITRFMIRYLIFVIKIKDYNLVLNQLYLKFIKFYQKYKSDKIFSSITHFHTYETAIFYILAA